MCTYPPSVSSDGCTSATGESSGNNSWAFRKHNEANSIVAAGIAGVPTLMKLTRKLSHSTILLNKSLAQIKYASKFFNNSKGNNNYKVNELYVVS